MARGGGGRGRKVTINSGKWHTVKSSKTNANDSDDEEVTKMTDADWQRYFEIMDDMQYHFVEQGELSSGLIQLFTHSLLIHILIFMLATNMDISSILLNSRRDYENILS